VIEEQEYEGQDRVISSVSYTLTSQNLENLTLTGTAALDGTGNQQDNEIEGNSGDNQLLGESGDDVLIGQEGNDTLDGGSGEDEMYGGLGDDHYFVDSEDDEVIEQLDEGTDTVTSSQDYALGDHIENLVLTGTQWLRGTGNDLDNHITGNAGGNYLDGQAGDDTLIGLGGNDTYYVDSADDEVIEAGDGGYDQVYSTAAQYTLAAYVEDLWMENAQAFDGTGNALNNQIIANENDNILSGEGGDDKLKGYEGDDSLYGGAGDDSLDGGLDVDIMYGGSGDDRYTVDNEADQVVELAGEGHDTVKSEVSFVLGDFVEDLRLQGTADIDGTGNNQDNFMKGNYGNNILSGEEGNDHLVGSYGYNQLFGGSGHDILDAQNGEAYLEGGTGDDRYLIDSESVTISELADEGYDRVESAVTYALKENLEALTLSGLKSISGIGNELDNDLFGNVKENELEGGEGKDSIDGFAGDDELSGDEGDDYLYGGDDAAYFSPADDDDDDDDDEEPIDEEEYFEEDEEPEEEDDDTVEGEYILASNDDYLDGGEGNDHLDGGSGDDTLEGGDGDDYLYGGDDGFIQFIGGNDETEEEETIDEEEPIDEEEDFEEDDIIEEEPEDDDTEEEEDDLIPSGLSNHDYLDGGAGDDVLDGGNGNDELYGGLGVDELIGGTGNDILDGGLELDTMSGGSGDDIYYVDGYSENIQVPVDDETEEPVEDIYADCDYGTAKEATATSVGSSVIGNLLGNDLGQNIWLELIGFRGEYYHLNNNAVSIDLDYGHLTVQPNGDYNYTPDDNHPSIEALNDGETLNEHYVSYKIIDELGESDTADLYLTISGATDENNGNGEPVEDIYAKSDYGTAQEASDTTLGSNVTGNLIGNDSGNQLWVELIGFRGTYYHLQNGEMTIDVDYGTLTVQENGDYVYTVDNDHPSIEALDEGETLDEHYVSYKIIDSQGESDTADLYLSVSGTTDAPLADENGGDEPLEAIYAECDYGTAQEAADTDSGTNVTGNLITNDSGNGLWLELIGFRGEYYHLQNGEISIDLDYGHLTVQENGDYLYTLDNQHPSVDALNEGESLNEHYVSYKIIDSQEESDTADLYLSIDGTMDGPQLPAAELLFGPQNGADTQSDTQQEEQEYEWVTIFHTDTVIENVNEGHDVVYASITYELPENVEELHLTGDENLDATGNEGDNLITGNSAHNMLNGAAGNDILRGGEGDDSYYYKLGDGIDTISDSAGLDRIVLDKTITFEQLQLQVETVNGEQLAQLRFIDDNGNVIADQGLDIVMDIASPEAPIETIVLNGNVSYDFNDSFFP